MTDVEILSANAITYEMCCSESLSGVVKHLTTKTAKINRKKTFFFDP